MSYAGLSRAQLSYEYLHTNSTTHEFLFGAMAEMVDNARDANATNLNISTVPNEEVRGGFMLCFLDDGDGMDSEEAGDVITFGKSSKRAIERQTIGQYGNGLKSGSMRVANDFILFTKAHDVLTCIFLSRTFHESEGIQEVIVPLPSFNARTREPMFKSLGLGGEQTHKIEMALIKRYSPFHSLEEFFAQFDRIKTKSGTLVIIYNLKLMDNGEPELDIHTDKADIRIASNITMHGEKDRDDDLMTERKSFRAYAAILYSDPRMKIYIQGLKVRTQKLVSQLFRPKLYKYQSSRFKARSELEVNKADQDARVAEDKAKEAEYKAKEIEKKYGSDPIAKDNRAILRQAQERAKELRTEAKLKRQIANKKQKSLKEPKVLTFYFGVNLAERAHYGLFIYNCSRLIRMSERVGAQMDGGLTCSGVIGIVDVPHLVLEPTHNKQNFADQKEYRHLLRAMGEHMEQYWKDIDIESEGVQDFWASFGYERMSKWTDPPSTLEQYAKKRAMHCTHLIQCDRCLKWRIIPYSAKFLDQKFPDNWECKMNTGDPDHNRCSAPEAKFIVSEGKLVKSEKSSSQKAIELEKQMVKKAEELAKLKRQQAVTSQRQLNQRVSVKEAAKGKKTSTVRAGRSTSKKQSESESESSEEESDSSEEEVEKVERSKKKAVAKPAVKKKPPPPPPPAKKPTSKPVPKSPSTSSTSSGGARTAAQVYAQRRAAAEAADRLTNKENSSRKRDRSDNSEEIVEKRGRSNSTTTVSPAKKEKESSKPASKHADVDKSIEVKRGSEWLAAKVVDVDGGRWQVKLQSSKDLIWVQKNGRDVREPVVENGSDVAIAAAILGPSVSASTKSSSTIPSSSSSITTSSTSQSASKKVTKESSPSTSTLPTSSKEPTVISTSSQNDILLTELAQSLRMVLRYFMPPDHNVSKDEVSNYTLEQLAKFDLENFFDLYEQGLSGLVKGFQSKADMFQIEAEKNATTLKKLRSNVAKLLKYIDETCEVDPDKDADAVDKYLEDTLVEAEREKQPEERNGPVDG